MYRLPLNSFLIDFILEVIIATLIFYSAFYAHSKITMKLPKTITYKFNILKIISNSNNLNDFKNQYTWFVIVFITYILFKGIIYTCIYSTVTAEVVSSNDRRTVIYKSSGGRHTTLGDSSVITVDSPVIQAEINGKLEQFEFERYFSDGEVKIGDEFTLVYMNVWGSPSYVNYGGLYFFRHDFTCMLFLILILISIRIRDDKIEDDSEVNAVVVDSTKITFHQCIAIALIMIFSTKPLLIVSSWIF